MLSFDAVTLEHAYHAGTGAAEVGQEVNQRVNAASDTFSQVTSQATDAVNSGLQHASDALKTATAVTIDTSGQAYGRAQVRLQCGTCPPLRVCMLAWLAVVLHSTRMISSSSLERDAAYNAVHVCSNGLLGFAWTGCRDGM